MEPQQTNSISNITTPVSNKERPISKSHIAIIFISIVAVLNVFFSFYTSNENNYIPFVPYYDSINNCQQVLEDVCVSSIDSTSDWKTYRNEEYGFEFKYPGDWVQQDGVLILKSDLDSASNSDKSDYKNSIFYFIDNTDIDQINPGQSISEYVRNTDVEGTIKSQKDVLVGGINSTQVMGGFDSTVLTTYIPIKKGILSFYIFTNSVSGSDTESLQKVYNQILSTFKFIPTKLSASVYTKPFQKGEYDYFGTLDATGYIEIIDEVCDPKMEGDIPCSQLTNYKSAVFHVTGSDSSLFMSWLGDAYENSLVGPDKITLGCYDDNKKIISYINSGDDGVVKSVINDGDLSSILSSTKSSPVKVQMVKSYNTAGKGAPLCYSVFRNFKVIK